MSKNNNYFYKTLAMSNDIIKWGALAINVDHKSPPDACLPAGRGDLGG